MTHELPPTITSTERGRVAIRPVVPGDTFGLERFYADLTPESRRRRFFAAVPGVSHRASVAFSTPDHRRGEGFVATAVVDGTERIVGHLCLVPAGERTAEIALAVDDRWQGRGIGRRLVGESIDWARGAGVDRLTATMLVENAPIRRLLTGLGLAYETRGVGLDVEAVTIRVGAPLAQAA